MYYLCSKSKGADQLRGHREADLRLCFHICKNWFSHDEAHIVIILSIPDSLWYEYMQVFSSLYLKNHFTSQTLIKSTLVLGGYWMIIEGYDLSLVMRKPAFAYAKTKMQINCAVTAQLISAFVFAIWIVQSLFSLNPKFQASSNLV